VMRFGSIRPLWRAPVPFLDEVKLLHLYQRRPDAMDAGVAQLKCIEMIEYVIRNNY
jgi:hypothetical protein